MVCEENPKEYTLTKTEEDKEEERGEGGRGGGISKKCCQSIWMSICQKKGPNSNFLYQLIEARSYI
jgi:hypothetical protein